MSPLTELITGAKAYGWSAVFSSTAFESIATVTVGSGGAADVTFSSIPSTYEHLQIRFSVTCATSTSMLLRVNSLNTSTYARHALYGDGATAYASGSANTTPYIYGYTGSITSTNPTVGIVDVLDYKNTNKNKTIRNLIANDKNGSGALEFTSLLYPSTTAITTLMFYVDGGNFAQNSHFALYGIKAAS